LRGIMAGKQMYVLFFCLGPTFSDFSTPCVQITDSAYVAHSEYILYRPGYEYFRSIGDSRDFFRYVHSAGELEGNVSKNIDQRRVYIDLKENIVFSTNTQYAGNTVGLKKLALRLAIRKASREAWLAEHMLLMGVHGPGGRVTYFSGAFPSACGKTSTAMCAGEGIVGDDIAYLREKSGVCRAANVEAGIFGIIQDVNPKDDPVIWNALTTPGEVIFSNVLVAGDVPYWLGDGRDVPEEGVNYSGEWYRGKKDKSGNAVSHSHKNARYTISLARLGNLDGRADDPEGVPLSGILFGGRDSDTSVPVQKAFDWAHGVLTMGASLESETTAATLGQEGVRKFNIMSNLDFLSIPLGQYIRNYLAFGKRLEVPPAIFGVNYFLRGADGKFLNAIEDKRVWLKWAESAVHNDVAMIESPTGFIPRYLDLQRLFQEVLGKDYSREDYVRQFTIRIPENLAKLERIAHLYYAQVPNTPDVLFSVFEEQQARLDEARRRLGEYISPLDLR
ncbi:MAG TPA: phosphoenolpyruvate carboxykinase (GTP), partial [bacterium]|nr:phosphoenolpyruvate carboxykinase (GTP) [bacterium]